MLNSNCGAYNSLSIYISAGGNDDAVVEQIATVVHGDLHDPLCLRAVQHTADCTMTLSHVENTPVNTFRCSTVCRRSSGKVLTDVRILKLKGFTFLK
jgi:hypothetical protein